MRIGFPAEHHFEQMARIVREPVDVRIVALQPSREQVNRQRKPYISVNNATEMH